MTTKKPLEQRIKRRVFGNERFMGGAVSRFLPYIYADSNRRKSCVLNQKIKEKIKIRCFLLWISFFIFATYITITLL